MMKFVSLKLVVAPVLTVIELLWISNTMNWIGCLAGGVEWLVVAFGGAGFGQGVRVDILRLDRFWVAQYVCLHGVGFPDVG